MRFSSTILTVLAGSAAIASAAPAEGKLTTGLRLIKTSPEDPGSWVTDADKLKYTAEGIHFVDITDITVSLNCSWNA